jgi:hypothetical protein
VAIKLDHHTTIPSYLEEEVNIYRSLSEPASFSQLYREGIKGDFTVMVFELVGPNLEDLLRYTTNPQLIGTCRCASINGHLGIGGQAIRMPHYTGIWLTSVAAPSRGDDLESLGYMTLYFMLGSLPWQGLKAPTKEQKYRLVLEKKQTTIVAELCGNLSTGIAIYMNCVRNIHNEDKPDHEYLWRILRNLFRRQRFEYDQVFDWTLRECQRRTVDCAQESSATPNAERMCGEERGQQLEGPSRCVAKKRRRKRSVRAYAVVSQTYVKEMSELSLPLPQGRVTQGLRHCVNKRTRSLSYHVSQPTFLTLRQKVSAFLLPERPKGLIVGSPCNTSHIPTPQVCWRIRLQSDWFALTSTNTSRIGPGDYISLGAVDGTPSTDNTGILPLFKPPDFTALVSRGVKVHSFVQPSSLEFRRESMSPSYLAPYTESFIVRDFAYIPTNTSRCLILATPGATRLLLSSGHDESCGFVLMAFCQASSH